MAIAMIEKQNKTGRITLQQWARAEGFSCSEEAMLSYEGEGGIPALCTQGCWVQPGGRCEHGNPSPSLSYDS